MTKPHNPNFQAWIDTKRAMAEEALANVMLSGPGYSVQTMQKASEHLMWGSGATAALVVANLDKLATVISTNGLRISLALLVVSLLLGLLCMLRAVSAHVAVSIVTQMQPAVLHEVKTFDEAITRQAREYDLNIADYNATSPSLQGAIDALLSSVPIWERIRIKLSQRWRSRREGYNPAMHDLASHSYWVATYGVLQLFFAGLFLLTMALSMNL